ncbi:MAG: hypothetical protein ACOVLB_04365 [Candidatus Nanopelagicus sp.]
MAQFTKVHGDYQPVMNYDAAGYTVGAIYAATSGASVQPAGPKLDFATITFTGTGTTPAQINAAIQTIQQMATVHIYEFTTDTNDTLAVAFYPVGAWGDVTATGGTTLDAQLTTATGEAVAITAAATFTG